jgi:hypothetical protein
MLTLMAAEELDGVHEARVERGGPAHPRRPGASLRSGGQGSSGSRARLNAHPCGWRWWPCRPAASSPRAGVASPRLRPGGSATGLGFAKNPTSPLPSAYVAVLIGSVDATTADEAAGGLIWRERFGRFLCSIGRSIKQMESHSVAGVVPRSNGARTPSS